MFFSRNCILKPAISFHNDKHVLAFRKIPHLKTSLNERSISWLSSDEKTSILQKNTETSSSFERSLAHYNDDIGAVKRATGQPKSRKFFLATQRGLLSTPPARNFSNDSISNELEKISKLVDKAKDLVKSDDKETTTEENQTHSRGFLKEGFSRGDLQEFILRVNRSQVVKRSDLQIIEEVIAKFDDIFGEYKRKDSDLSLKKTFEKMLVLMKTDWHCTTEDNRKKKLLSEVLGDLRQSVEKLQQSIREQKKTEDEEKIVRSQLANFNAMRRQFVYPDLGDVIRARYLRRLDENEWF